MLILEKLDKPFEKIKARESIVFTCDYCGDESNKKKYSYVNSRKIIEKDCCSNRVCVAKKIKESNLKVHGVEYNFQIKYIINKIKDTCMKKFGVEHASKLSETQEKKKQTNLKKYGYEHVSSSPEIKEKVKQTCLERFGVEYSLQSPEVKEKSRQTNIEKYGHEHAMQSPEILEKTRQTNIEKYGVEYQISSLETREKIKQTNIQRYGVENPNQRPEILEKTRETNIERYGVEYIMQSSEMKEKARQTSLEKFGHDHASSSPEIQEKVRQTNLERFGHEYASSSPEFKEKVRQTCLERFGYENPFLSPEVQEKVRQICLEKFGHEYASSSPEIKEKVKQTCLDRFGVEYPIQSPEIQEKIRQTNIERYGSPYPQRKYGKTQKEIQNWLNSFGFNFQSDHTVLGSKELDLYDSNLKFAIEYCGLYWHHENSPQPRPSNYHISKFNICKEKGIQLITIFEDEWLNNQEVIKSVILSKLGVFEKRLYARKCTAKEISKKEFTDFCDKHHVQGGNSLAKVCFGLYCEDELIGVMDLGVHHRKQTKGEMVLTRLCFKAGHQIVGGASKLFSHCVNWCKNNGIKKIISWSDSRWSNGSIYKNLNFKLEEELGSDYAYVNMSYPKERISKQSQMKCNTGCPKDISEKEWALQNGLSRIWDCGKVRWAFNV
jgi:hypothetical protein